MLTKTAVAISALALVACASAPRSPPHQAATADSKAVVAGLWAACEQSGFKPGTIEHRDCVTSRLDSLYGQRQGGDLRCRPDTIGEWICSKD